MRKVLKHQSISNQLSISFIQSSDYIAKYYLKLFFTIVSEQVR
jgi:hypothetical protein